MDHAIPVVITAEGADVKLANRLLLHLRDCNEMFEKDSEGDWDASAIVRSKTSMPKTSSQTTDTPSLEDLERMGRRGWLPNELFEVDSPPIREFHNDWEGTSIDIVERLMVMKENESQTRRFLLLDDQGVRDRTVIFLERRMTDDFGRYLDVYDKMRVPWYRAYTIYVNLDISNMSWEDFVQDPNERPADDWWLFQDWSGDKSSKRKAERMIKELEKLDLA